MSDTIRRNGHTMSGWYPDEMDAVSRDPPKLADGLIFRLFEAVEVDVGLGIHTVVTIKT